MLSWQWPWIGLLLPLPWLLRQLLPESESRRAAIRVPFYAALTQLSGTAGKTSAYRLRVLSAVLMWVMLVLSAARPVWFGEPVSIATSGRDLMLAIDLSDSMRIDDMQIEGEFVTRMQAIKHVAGEFIERRKGDRLGLILFGQRSYLQAPLMFVRQSIITWLCRFVHGNR